MMRVRFGLPLILALTALPSAGGAQTPATPAPPASTPPGATPPAPTMSPRAPLPPPPGIRPFPTPQELVGRELTLEIGRASCRERV